jgi:uncharacterized phosphosugar-binding protein
MLHFQMPLDNVLETIRLAIYNGFGLDSNSIYTSLNSRYTQQQTFKIIEVLTLMISKKFISLHETPKQLLIIDNIINNKAI